MPPMFALLLQSVAQTEEKSHIENHSAGVKSMVFAYAKDRYVKRFRQDIMRSKRVVAPGAGEFAFLSPEIVILGCCLLVCKVRFNAW